MSARKRLYLYILDNGLGFYQGERLRQIGEISDWARVMRQLRQDGVLEYSYNLDTQEYHITAINSPERPSKRIALSRKTKYRIRQRDGHRCQACGKGVADGVKLHVDHKIPVEWGGSNYDDNLWLLCEECNLGKQAFFADDFDPGIMQKVNLAKSGYQKLKVLFEESPNKKFSPSILQGIAGIRDWTRTIRSIRAEHGINITFMAATKEFPNGYYVNIVKAT